MKIDKGFDERQADLADQRAHPGGDRVVTDVRVRWRLLLLASAVALALFICVAILVRADGPLVRFDHSLANALARSMSMLALKSAFAVTQAGNALTLYVVGVVVAIHLLWKHRWHEAVLWIFTTLLNGVWVRLLKGLFQRVRPEYAHGLVVEGSYSFPSGHAQGSMVVYGLMTYLAVRSAPPRWRAPMVCAAFVSIGCIGSSRILLHVHYLSDVAGGLLFGMSWLLLCIAAFEWADGRRGVAAGRP